MNKIEIFEITFFVFFLFACVDIFMKDSFLRYIINLIIGG